MRGAHRAFFLDDEEKTRAVECRQLGEYQSAVEPVGDAFPRVNRHMFCRDAIPFVLFCRRLRNRTPGLAQCRSAYCFKLRRRRNVGPVT